MTSLNLELFPWLWSLHSRFGIASLMKIAFCVFPVVCHGSGRCLGLGELGDGSTPHTGASFFVWEEGWSFSREMDFLVYEKWESIWLSGWPPLSPCLSAHLCRFAAAHACSISSVEQGQALCVQNYWLNPELFKTNALVSVKTLNEKLSYLEILNIF